MTRPTYYIWMTEEMKKEELEQIKNYWNELGFRSVIFYEGNNVKDINEGLKAVLKNHGA